LRFKVQSSAFRVRFKVQGWFRGSGLVQGFRVGSRVRVDSRFIGQGPERTLNFEPNVER
jgi:hypothetical protein